MIVQWYTARASRTATVKSVRNERGTIEPDLPNNFHPYRQQEAGCVVPCDSRRRHAVVERLTTILARRTDQIARAMAKRQPQVVYVERKKCVQEQYQTLMPNSVVYSEIKTTGRLKRTKY